MCIKKNLIEPATFTTREINYDPVDQRKSIARPKRTSSESPKQKPC